MKFLKFPLIALLFAGILTLAFYGCKKEAQSPSLTSDARGGAPKTTLDAPGITCGTSTEASIEVTVTAGASGAPAGFTIQWMTAADYAANGWSDAPCDASFSGNANGYYYSLAAGASVTVNIGDILYDNPGASTTCGDALQCGTDYIFRAFAHANNTVNKSDFSSNLTCSTLACSTDYCSFSQGYWFNSGHGASTHTWPGSITLGNCTYDEATGRAIKDYMIANGGLGGDVRQSFLQASAIKLSFFGETIPAEIQGYMATLDTFLGSLDCLTPTSIPTVSDTGANAAAQAISDWIDAHHCQ